MFERPNATTNDQRLSERDEAEAYVHSVMAPEAAEDVIRALTPEQISLVRQTVEAGKKEQQKWEQAQREGRIGEMVAKFNARSEAIIEASKILLPDEIDGVLSVLDESDNEREAWERARREGRTQEMVDAYNKASSGELSKADKKRSWYSALWK